MVQVPNEMEFSLQIDLCVEGAIKLLMPPTKLLMLSVLNTLPCEYSLCGFKQDSLIQLLKATAMLTQLGLG